ncbi:MAG: hypothetical protein E6I87_01920 [Chloroflexi bacterium]|nr:MAG: hypothetical protein E6I87_01920 [Chloroflexota bacterium]
MVRPDRDRSRAFDARARVRGPSRRRERALNTGRVYDLVGHVIGLLSLARPRRARGVTQYVSDRGLAFLILKRRGYSAITFGHVIVSLAPLTERGWRHELAHVGQYDRLGLRFIPLYLWHYSRVGYARHPFEREAEAESLDSTM